MNAQSATVKASLPKPELRNAGKKAWTIALVGSIFVSSAFAVWFKSNVVEARKKHYADFYNKWDDEKEFEAMRKAGVFKGFEA